MYDYIIIGAGSSGCLLANRLSKNPNNQVLLLEAGPRDRNPLIHMPGGAGECLKSSKLNWKNISSPQKQLNNRAIEIPRGKMLGGSSSINGMIYIRGHQSDYDEWQQQGNPGWSWQEVLPYFKRAEKQCRGMDDYHGADGELSVVDAPSDNPLFDCFVAAGIDIGLPHNNDFNGEQQEGVGRYQATIQHGKRCSSASAFLRPVEHRSNLTIQCNALVKRLLVKSAAVSINDGNSPQPNANGAEYLLAGKNTQALARKEVILCAGTIKSPQILQLSGIGDQSLMEKLGINCVKHLPGVGQNLQEHLDLTTHYLCSQPITLNGPATQWRLKLQSAWQYLRHKSGPAACNNVEAGAFIKSTPDLNRPDLQMHFLPGLLYGVTDPLPTTHGMTLHCCNLRPKSRGQVTIKSLDASLEPTIDFNFLSEEEDWQKMLQCYHWSEKIMQSEVWRPFISASLSPGSRLSDEADIRDFIRQHSHTVYHPVGTCKMGNDRNAVVNHELKVHDVSGLRIADCSIFPTLIGGNTNAPAMMVAEKVADMILNSH